MTRLSRDLIALTFFSQRRYRSSCILNEMSCYVSDLEKGEKTLLLYKGEGKLSRVRSRLIYRFSKGSSVHRAGLHSGVEADRSDTVTDSWIRSMCSRT